MFTLPAERALAMRERLPGLLSFSIIENVIFENERAARLEHRERAGGIAHDHADDRMVGGVGNGESVDVHALGGEGVTHFGQRARLIGDEDRELLDDSHDR